VTVTSHVAFHFLALSFAHLDDSLAGSGSGRYSPRNKSVSQALNDSGMGTFLVDLLTKQEELEDEYTGTMISLLLHFRLRFGDVLVSCAATFRFDIPMLAQRLSSIVKYLQTNEDTKHLK
jgi:hypothetical protein